MPDLPPPDRHETAAPLATADPAPAAEAPGVGPTDPPAASSTPPPTDPPPEPPAGDKPADPAPFARRRRPAPATLALGAVVVGIALYGTAGFLRETGLYDVARGWSKPAAAPSLAALSGPPAPDAPRALRDQPPRPPLADLPQFTVRDGETHDYLTDLDAETLKRLAEVQGQLDGLGAQVTVIRQGLQALASGTERQRRQEAAHQDRLHRALAAARADIAALHATVGDVDARLKRAHHGPAGALAGGGRPLPGWSVTAISGDRAWLRTPRGGRVTVVAGERLKGVGTVRAVDGLRGVVTMSDGRVVR